MIAEVTGPSAAIEAVLADADPVARALEVAGDGDALHPVLAAALAAARTPTYRIWTEGVDPGLTVLGDPSGAVLLVEEPAGALTLLGASPEEVPFVLVAAVALDPRPISDDSPVPAIGRLGPGVRHWTVRRAHHGPEHGAPPRTVEVVDGEGGIWRVRPVTGGVAELEPTTSTDVLRDLVALSLECAPVPEQGVDQVPEPPAGAPRGYP